jgi:hypothetical protein
LLNTSLATADYLQEDLRQLWSQGTKRQARRFLISWVRRAEASGIRLSALSRWAEFGGSSV